MQDSRTIIKEPSQVALRLLEDAEREFEAGDITQASIKFWGAATSAVSAVAGQLGWKCESDHDMKNLVEWIASDSGNERLAAQYSAIQMFYLRVEYDLAEDFQLDSSRPIVHKFVENMLTLLKD